MTATAVTGGRLGADEVAALEEQRDFLLASLDDLDREHEAGDLDDDDYDALHDDYTARAATVLEALRRHGEAVEADRRPRRWGLTVGVALAVVVFAALAGFLVASTSGERRPGETLTGAGAIRQTGSSRAQECMTLTQAVFTGSGGDLATKGVDALKCYDAVLEEAPGNPQAHAYRGWTAALIARRLDGALPEDNVRSLVSRASEDLADARKADPTYPDAIVFSAILELWQGDQAGARAELGHFDDLDLPESNQMVQLVDTMLRPQLEPTSTTAPPASTTASPTSTP